jgi:predicted DNA-binding protein
MAAQERQRAQISVPIPAELRQRLELAAQRDHRSVASLVRHLVAQALEQQGEAA